MVRGIDAFGESTVDLGIVCRVKPMKQMEVERGMRLAIKEGFDSRGLEFPYPRLVTVPWGEHYTAPEDLPISDQLEKPLHPLPEDLSFSTEEDNAPFSVSEEDAAQAEYEPYDPFDMP